MKQFQFFYEDEKTFLKEVRKIKQWCDRKLCSNLVFHIFTLTAIKEKITNVATIIENEIPKAYICASSSAGNIADSLLGESEILVICNIYEYDSTRVKILQGDISNPESIGKFEKEVFEFLGQNSWVKAMEVLITSKGLNTNFWNDEHIDFPKNITVFGGSSFNTGFDDKNCVYSNVGGYSKMGIVLVFYGGEDFYISTDLVLGWKPLGRTLTITKTHDCVLDELDGKPAFEVYYKYLSVKNDIGFFKNSIEFPFSFTHKGTDCLRIPTGRTSQNGLQMNSGVYENSKVRISYGDPDAILDQVRSAGEKLSFFQPEQIMVYSCASRKDFWGEEDVSLETSPLQQIAPTAGFYTSGEYLSCNGYITNHNVAMVIVGLREGEKAEDKVPFEMPTLEFSGKIGMINRLANFVQVSNDELEEANRKLVLAAKTDGMTGLYNRMEEKEQISKVMDSLHQGNIRHASLIMFDLDDFKRVNDIYGHAEGDAVILGLCKIIKEGLDKDSSCGAAGRWGGEEFMLVLPEVDGQKAFEVAENYRRRFETTTYAHAPSQTTSVGVTEILMGDDIDDVCIRVDNALYEAKQTGKNKVVIH